jgi:hypothetical protein
MKRKTEQVTEQVKEKTKQELAKQTERVVSKIFPPFDHGIPDTENNKKRFIDFLRSRYHA